jgi:outer membrane murein-binding lipoprotein Lpp
MKNLLFLLFFSFCISIQAQDAKIVKAFDSLVLNSNNWTQYRVIKKEDLSSYKNELIANSDSLSSVIKTLNERITNLEQNLSATEKENTALKNELGETKNALDEIDVLGIALPKATYSVIVWTIILILVLVLVFVGIKLRNRIIVTDELKENLENTSKEFEEYKHKALEKQQKLGRELIDAQKLAQSRNPKK